MCNLVDSNYVSIEDHAYVTAYEIKNFFNSHVTVRIKTSYNRILLYPRYWIYNGLRQ